MPRKEGEPVDAGVGGGAGDLHVRHPRADAQAVIGLDRGGAEAPAEPHHDAGHAAVPDDQVGAEPEDRDGHLRRDRGKGFGEIGLVGGSEKHLGRAADPEPGVGRERLIAAQPAAQAGQARAEVAGEAATRTIPPRHAARDTRRACHDAFASWPGSA